MSPEKNALSVVDLKATTLLQACNLLVTVSKMLLYFMSLIQKHKDNQEVCTIFQPYLLLFVMLQIKKNTINNFFGDDNFSVTIILLAIVVSIKSIFIYIPPQHIM